MYAYTLSFSCSLAKSLVADKGALILHLSACLSFYLLSGTFSLPFSSPFSSLSFLSPSPLSYLSLPSPHSLLSIMANRSGNTVLFHEEGGMDVGDIDSKAHRVQVDIEDTLSEEQARLLVSHVSPEKQEYVSLQQPTAT